MEENPAERAENEALVKAQVDKMRWRAELPELPRLTFARALRRILCPHNHTGGTVDGEVWISWCNRCGHTEMSLAPLAADELLPEGRPAWYSTPHAPVREASSFWVFVFALCMLTMAIAWALRVLV